MLQRILLQRTPLQRTPLQRILLQHTPLQRTSLQRSPLQRSPLQPTCAPTGPSQATEKLALQAFIKAKEDVRLRMEAATNKESKQLTLLAWCKTPRFDTAALPTHVRQRRFFGLFSSVAMGHRNEGGGSSSFKAQGAAGSWTPSHPSREPEGHAG